MTAAPLLYLRIGGEARGPFDRAQVIELVAGGAINAATDAAAPGENTWVPLGSHPAGESLFPERVVHGFKETEFNRINENSATAPVDLTALIASANQARSANDRTKPASPPPLPAGPNDVEQLLQINLKKENAAGLTEIEYREDRRTRRPRDFAISLALGGVILVGGGLLSSGAAGVLAGSFLFIFYACGLWWVFYQILDKY